MSWEISIHPEVAIWLRSLDSACYQRCRLALESLQLNGPNLGRPLVDHIKASAIVNLKELRISCSGGRQIRLLFAFNPERIALVLVGGDKKGQWENWYPNQIKLSEQRYLENLVNPGRSFPNTSPNKT